MRFPLLSPPLQLFRGDPELDDVLHCVNVDSVPVLDKGDGPTDLGLGRDVTNTEPMGTMGICVSRGKGDDQRQECQARKWGPEFEPRG